jgi:tetratricopeptide (TPR) repeat protein
MIKGHSALLGIAGIIVAGLAFASALANRSQVNSLKAELGKDKEILALLKTRLDLMDRKLDRVPAQRSGSSGVESDSAIAPSDPDFLPKTGITPRPNTPATPGTASSDDEFEELRKKFFEDTATDAEKEKFWKLVREKPGLLDDLIKRLEKASADSPRDKEALRRLSDAYLAKLMAVPDGMEKGAWSNKMIATERKILEVDPQDWDARYSIAMNYSFWPEQFNKRPDAIKEFDTLKRIQESRSPEPKFAQTYLQLRQLYLKEGRVDDAKAILEEGLRRFPEDAELIKARDGAK